MQLVALIQSSDHVCCRYRLAAFRSALEQAGHTLTLRRLPRRWWSRWLVFRDLYGASVIVQRFLLPRWQLHLLRNRVRHLLFDFDDAVFLRDSHSAKGQHHPTRMRRFAAMVRASDAIIAGNSFLAEHAARWAGAHRVFLAPTCVDPARYRPRVEPGEGNELAWIGSASTLKGLQTATPMLERLGKRFPDLRLKVICDRFPRFAHLPVIGRPWSEANEAEALAESDIGISWVPDDEWSRGKCGLKLLQYMAAGLPVIANPVGVHQEMIRHGETGYFASTPEQWQEAVAQLRDNPELRQRMGRAGRSHLESRYPIAAGASVWLDVLRRIDGGLARTA